MSKIWTPDRRIVAPSRRIWTPPSRQRGFVCLPGGLGAGRPGGGGGGAFPVVESVAHKYSTTNTSVLSANMPSGIVAGDLLVAFALAGGTATASGWTANQLNAAGNIVVFHKIAVGGDTLTMSATSTRCSITVFRISGANSVQSAFNSFNPSASPDTPSLSPAGGAKNYLAFSALVFVSGNTSTTVTSTPSGYADYTRSTPAGTNSSSVHTSRAEVAGATVDPGAWSLSASIFSMCATTAVWQS